jgi:quercetin dioxygenase-like cupin family protein
MNKVNLIEKFNKFSDYWSPKVIGELNGQSLKAVKLKGEFVWHHHDDEDEMFLVVKGSLNIELSEGKIALNEGEFLIVPKGVEHRPVANEEAWVLLFEPLETLNTGNVKGERTKDHLDRI